MRFPDPDEYTDYLAIFESAKRRLSETAQAFAIRVTDLAKKAYPTLNLKVKDDNDPEKIYLGTAQRIQRISNVNHPVNLSMAVKTISRMD